MTINMKISLITPTADQPTGIALAERFIARQTVKPDEWIVADDGETPATLTMGQVHIVRKRQHEGGRSLASNMLAALEVATGDLIIIIEHDDWYAPDHIETCVQRLKAGGATGSINQRYYNVEHRSYRLMKNIGSALCNTAFTSDHKKGMKRAAEKAFRDGRICVDRYFWDALPRSYWDIHSVDTVVGIKGLPGRKGLGLGHRPDHRWTDDDGTVLRQWVGDDADEYLKIARGFYVDGTDTRR